MGNNLPANRPNDLSLVFEGLQVRVVAENGELWFNANDVCEALGYANPRDALSRHTRPKDVAKHDTLSPTLGAL